MIPIQHCSNLGEFLKIACAIINLFHKPILMQNADNALAQRMLQLAQTENLLQMRVERLHLRRGAGVWIEMGQNQLNFPRLPLQYLLDKTFGTYQVRLAPAYIQDTLGRDRIR
ncbi:hypothetical protein JTB14_009971 [Gonioctena quinquepunctata]|nr:hypothetical protein JTB14_009971 [Gonioctena quinquepunctata]